MWGCKQTDLQQSPTAIIGSAHLALNPTHSHRVLADTETNETTPSCEHRLLELRWSVGGQWCF